MVKLIIHTRSGRTITINYPDPRGAEEWATAYSHWASTEGRYDGSPVLDVALAASGGRFVVPFFSIESMEIA